MYVTMVPSPQLPSLTHQPTSRPFAASGLAAPLPGRPALAAVTHSAVRVHGRLVGAGPLMRQSTLALATDGRRSPGAWRAALRPVPPAPGLAARHRAAAGRAGTCLRRLNKSALLNPSDCTALTVCGDGEEEEDSLTKLITGTNT